MTLRNGQGLQRSRIVLLTWFISLWRCLSSRDRVDPRPRSAQRQKNCQHGRLEHVGTVETAQKHDQIVHGQMERFPEHETQPNAHSVWIQFSNAAVSAHMSFEDLFGRPRVMASMDQVPCLPGEDERVEGLKASVSVHPGWAGAAIVLLGLLCNQKSNRH